MRLESEAKPEQTIRMRSGFAVFALFERKASGSATGFFKVLALRLESEAKPEQTIIRGAGSRFLRNLSAKEAVQRHNKVRNRRKAMAEINVVPYIDVMLVLLIIFMITAPLLQLGVEVDLPAADARPMDEPQDPVVVNVLADGSLVLSLDGDSEPIDAETLINKVGAMVRNNPDMSVLIGGDRSVDYGRVYEAMVILQQAGVEKIGLMSDPMESS